MFSDDWITKEKWLLNEEDIEGYYVRMGDKRILLDRYGLILWKKYVWTITISNPFLHRFEDGRLVAFHRQLLNLKNDKKERVQFDNGNKLDYRILNLCTRTKGRYIDLQSMEV